MIDQYPIFVNTTLPNAYDFQIKQNNVQTIYEGKNVTSLDIDTESKHLFAADRNDHKILKFDYDRAHLQAKNVTIPEAVPLYLNIPHLESIALFNHSLFWTSSSKKETLVKANVDGWANSTQVLVQSGLASQMQIADDLAWYLSPSGALVSVDLDPLDTLRETDLWEQAGGNLDQAKQFLAQEVATGLNNQTSN